MADLTHIPTGRLEELLKLSEGTGFDDPGGEWINGVRVADIEAELARRQGTNTES